jgi:hypothetical protein
MQLSCKLQDLVLGHVKLHHCTVTLTNHDNGDFLIGGVPVYGRLQRARSIYNVVDIACSYSQLNI